MIPDLNRLLKSRLIALENIAKQGVIPGQLDTYELEQMIGRIKELTLVIALIIGLIDCKTHEELTKSLQKLKLEPVEYE
jgi:hypothetical protein